MTARNPNKLFYSISNIEQSYVDLAEWFTDILKNGEKESVTKQEIINFLHTKKRVPPGILKNNKPPKDPQHLCIAICSGSKQQCKNESTENSDLCKTHQNHPPARTINDPENVEESESEAEEEVESEDEEVESDSEESENEEEVESEDEEESEAEDEEKDEIDEIFGEDIEEE